MREERDILEDLVDQVLLDVPTWFGAEQRRLWRNVAPKLVRAGVMRVRYEGALTIFVTEYAAYLRGRRSLRKLRNAGHRATVEACVRWNHVAARKCAARFLLIEPRWAPPWFARIDAAGEDLELREWFAPHGDLQTVPLQVAPARCGADRRRRAWHRFARAPRRRGRRAGAVGNVGSNRPRKDRP
jgi:hypothetical protein